MTAPAFVAQCQRQGIRLTVVAGKLKASGKPPPKPEVFAAFLKARKEEIVAELIGLPKAGTSGSFEAPSGQNRPTEASAGKSEKETENGAKPRETARVWSLDDDLTQHPAYVKRPRWASGYNADGERAGEWLQSLTDAQRSLLFLLETRDVPRPPDWSKEDEAAYRALWSADLTRWAGEVG